MKPMATRNRPDPPEKWWEAGLALLFTILTIVGMVFTAFIVTELMAVEYPPPETRCFETAYDKYDYCRTQRAW